MAMERKLKQVVTSGGLTGTATSVEVDVYDNDNPGVLLATIPNADVSEVGSGLGLFMVDLTNLSVSIGYPASTDPLEKSWTLVFKDDAANAIPTTASVSGLPGPKQSSRQVERRDPKYTTTPISARGISNSVINKGEPSYVHVRVSSSLNWTTPDYEYWEVLHYDANARVSSFIPQSTEPAAGT